MSDEQPDTEEVPEVPAEPDDAAEVTHTEDEGETGDD